MKLGWFTTLRSGVLAIILHLVLGTLLILSFDLTPPPKSRPRVNTVEAVTVDKKQVESELQRLKDLDADKQNKEKQRLEELEKKAKNLEKSRLEEERKLAEAKKLKEQEQKKRKEEEARVVKLEKEKAELKKKRELEELKIKEAEAKAEKLKAEDAARQKKLAEEKKAAEEKKRLEQETAKRKAEEEQKKKLAAETKRLEEALAAELAAEESAEQARKDETLINRITSNITRSIESRFNTVGLADGLECILRVRLVPGGEVIDVSIAKSSGDDIFDRRAVNATQKASPLPVPKDVATFDRLGLREINMRFKPTN